MKVDEDGVEAVAFTEFSIEASGSPEEKPTIEFRCDIPFLFVILEGTMGNYLFAGYAGNGEGSPDEPLVERPLVLRQRTVGSPIRPKLPCMA